MMVKIQAEKLFLWTLLLLLGSGLAFQAAAETKSASRTAFEKLKALEGTWKGGGEGEGDEPFTAIHEFRVSANGTVIMETMGPGTEHEMINMYHMDGNDLVLTHYCAGGNQPTMKLKTAAAKPNELEFDFTGGTNLDPAEDEHIHSARIVLKGEDDIESNWTAYRAGEKAGEMKFTLTRDGSE